MAALCGAPDKHLSPECVKIVTQIQRMTLASSTNHTQPVFHAIQGPIQQYLPYPVCVPCHPGPHSAVLTISSPCSMPSRAPFSSTCTYKIQAVFRAIDSLIQQYLPYPACVPCHPRPHSAPLTISSLCSMPSGALVRRMLTMVTDWSSGRA